MSIYKDRLAQKRELDEKIEAARRAERDAAIASIRELMAQYGINTTDVAAEGRGLCAARSSQRIFLDDPLPLDNGLSRVSEQHAFTTPAPIRTEFSGYAASPAPKPGEFKRSSTSYVKSMSC